MNCRIPILSENLSFFLNRLPYSIWYASAFILGICWQAGHMPSYLAFFSIFFILYLSQHALPHLVQTSAITLFFIGGAWRYLSHETTLHYQLSCLCDKPLNLKGKILEIGPQPHIVIVDPIELKHSSTTESVALPTIPIQLTLHKDNPIVTHGDTIEVSHIWFAYPSQERLISLQRKGIIANCYVSRQREIIITPGPLSFFSYFSVSKNNILKKTSASLSPATATLFSSIFLGANFFDTDSTVALRKSFSWWGISHYLARSGLHLVLLASMLHFFACLLPLSYHIKQLILLLCIWGYALLSWPSISFMRANMMIFCNVMCTLIKVPTNNMHFLMCSTIAMLLYNPSYLYCLEFQLSFFLTFGLTIIQHSESIIGK